MPRKHGSVKEDQKLHDHFTLKYGTYEVKKYFWKPVRKRVLLLSAAIAAVVVLEKTAPVQSDFFAACSLYPLTLEEPCRLV